ncbi:arsenate reductase (glutaredoxin) [Gramella sp. AN32]|uniref:Arsenate reductase (Glutaredoxin) n=1 Tax=Christiangramia antarctica TaxID=2058158 RepID=A0ABW5X5S5_9FLAO|nr:arsenate reductase (glutaredoxin) [Gramella sp. AN32]MCM4156058.1 arsenate reductase (glutaredoxin) [Gramella sp. AN32]
MITIYHNPRCKKSREGLEVVKVSGKEYEVIEYLKVPIEEKKLKELLNKLGIGAIELVRTQEKIWKEEFKGKDFNNDELISILIKNPILIERPIITNNDKAVIGRPAEKIETIL